MGILVRSEFCGDSKSALKQLSPRVVGEPTLGFVDPKVPVCLLSLALHPTDVIPFQSQYKFMCKVVEAWDWNHRWIYTLTLPCSTKRIPVLE